MSSQYYDYQLTLDKLIRKAALVYPDTEIVYAPPNGPIIRSNYANEWDRIQRLGSVLEELGVRPGELVSSVVRLRSLIGTPLGTTSFTLECPCMVPYCIR
uniref:hypothetical protein n=1 Tax=Vulcanisaeta sp. JCM 14467 TaxID=1295370 RepID=UPI000A3E88F8